MSSLTLSRRVMCDFMIGYGIHRCTCSTYISFVMYLTNLQPVKPQYSVLPVSEGISYECIVTMRQTYMRGEAWETNEYGGSERQTRMRALCRNVGSSSNNMCCIVRTIVRKLMENHKMICRNDNNEC